MDVKITGKRLKGNVGAISSKSYAHRILICAALGQSECRIHIKGVLSEDIAATITCLEALGARVATEDGLIMVQPIRKVEGIPVLDCGESGSTARFLLPIVPCIYDRFEMTGRGRLPQRPFSPICDEMKKHGCMFSSDKLPMKVQGKLTSGEYYLPGDVSSQYITGLLYALPLLHADSRIVLTSPLESSGYVSMTLEVLSQFGIVISEELDGYFIQGGQSYQSPSEVTVEGDWSNGAFFLSMDTLNGGITVEGLNEYSLQGDRRIKELLRELPCEVDVSQIPDLVPVLSVAAAATVGVTRIYGGSRLRLKESDRLETTAAMLNNLGGEVEITSDGLIIKGKPRLKGGMVDSAGDHRIVMAAATAACVCDEAVIIRGAEAVNKSYPGFFQDLRMIGGEVEEL